MAEKTNGGYTPAEADKVLEKAQRKLAAGAELKPKLRKKLEKIARQYGLTELLASSDSAADSPGVQRVARALGVSADRVLTRLEKADLVVTSDTVEVRQLASEDDISADQIVAAVEEDRKQRKTAKKAKKMKRELKQLRKVAEASQRANVQSASREVIRRDSVTGQLYAVRVGGGR